MALTDILQQIKTAFMASDVLQQAYGFDKNKSFDEQFSELSVEAGDINLFANVQANTETIITADKTDIQTIVKNAGLGTVPWYVTMAKRFQWSAETPYYLVADPDTGKIGYNVENVADRIVTQASAEERVDDGARRVLVKVATGEPGKLHPLTGEQYDDFENYMRQVKIAGVRMEIVNLPADLLELDCEVYYDPAYNNDLLKEAIIASLDRYSMEVRYGGVIYRNAVIDAIQRVPGVKDVYIKSLVGIQGENEASRKTIERSYTTYSGYFNIKKTTEEFPGIELKPEQ